jgi:mRNA interferase RelE/StbE
VPQWTVQVAPPAARDLNDLPPRVPPAVVKFIYGPLAEEPKRVGKPLIGDLTGLWSARRGTFRILYELDDETELVIVVKIAGRADVYRPTQGKKDRRRDA